MCDDRAAHRFFRHLLGGELCAEEHAGLVDGDDTMPAVQVHLDRRPELPEIPALFTKMSSFP